MNKSSCLKLQGLQPCYLVWSIISLTSTKIVQIIPLGPKMGLPQGSQVYIGLFRENMKKIFLLETIRPRALIFGMRSHLVDLYQNCSYDPPGIQMGLPGGSHEMHRHIGKI